MPTQTEIKAVAQKNEFYMDTISLVTQLGCDWFKGYKPDMQLLATRWRDNNIALKIIKIVNKYANLLRKKL